MKKAFIPVVALSVIALSSCQKQGTELRLQAQGQNTIAHKVIPGTNYFVLELPSWDCHDAGGNCIPWTVHTGKLPQLVKLLDVVRNNTPEQVRQYFSDNRADLLVNIPAELVDGVINRECTVAYSDPANIPDVAWLIFKDGDLVLDYLRIKIEA